MSSLCQERKNESKYFQFNNFIRKKVINPKDYNTLNNTYNNYFQDKENSKYNYNDFKCLSEENQNITNSNDSFSNQQKEGINTTYNRHLYPTHRAYNLKQNPKNKIFVHQFQNNYNYQNLNKNLNLKRSRTNYFNYKISQIQSELASINSDNVMMKEDIYKYTDMNKYIENEIKIQKEHNEALYNKNQNLIQENETLALQLEQDEKELNSLIQENEDKHKIFDENQLNLELRNEKVNNDYDELMEINTKTKNDIESLCINYEELNNKNIEVNKEIEYIKGLQNKQFTDIEEKIKAIISEIEILKHEKNLLMKENQEKKNKNEIISKEKEDFYKKYQEQILINDTMNKKLFNDKVELDEIKKKLEEKKTKKEKVKQRAKSSNKRKYLIQELQKKIEAYKLKTLKKSNNDDFSF